MGPDPLFKKVCKRRNTGSSAASPSGASWATTTSIGRRPIPKLLGEMSKVAAAAHTPFIAGLSDRHADGQLAGTGESSRPDQGSFTTPGTRPGGRFANPEDARYLGLAMPRYCHASPQGQNEPGGGIRLRGGHGSGRSQSLHLGECGYAMAVNINRSFKLYGWCSRIRGIESGGSVEGLPTHTFPTDDGGVDAEMSNRDRHQRPARGRAREERLHAAGHRKNSDFAAFIGAQSLQKPFEYDDPDATANANLSARLLYLFACCRLPHLKCIVRQDRGRSKSGTTCRSGCRTGS